LQVQHVGLHERHLLGQQLLLLLHGQELSLDGGLDVADLGRNLALDLIDLALELLHQREARLVKAQLVLIVGQQLAAGLLQALDDRGFANFAQQHHAARGLGLAPTRLGLDAVLARLRQRRVQRTQILFAQVAAAVATADDLLLLRERDQLALGVLKLQAKLLQPVLEIGLGIRGGVEPPLQVRGDERLGKGNGHLLRDRRIGTVEVHAHQARVAHRLDGQAAHDQAGGSRVARGQLGLGRVADALVAMAGKQAAQRRPRRRRRQPLERLALGQRQLRGHALGQGPALEQFVLGLVEIGAGTALDRGHAFDVDHLDGVALDLQQSGGAVDRRHQQGADQGRHQHDAQRAQHRPAALDQDPPVAEQVDFIAIAAAFLGTKVEAECLAARRGQGEPTLFVLPRRQLGCRQAGRVRVSLGIKSFLG